MSTVYDVEAFEDVLILFDETSGAARVEFLAADGRVELSHLRDMTTQEAYRFIVVGPLMRLSHPAQVIAFHGTGGQIGLEGREDDDS